MEKSFELNLFELSLSNFATFQNQTIYFHNQFNAIIGETGSGKSLILDALQLILGHRADKKIIRKGCEHAIVEAIFKCHCQRIKTFLDQLGFPFEGEEVVIKRILYRNGKSKSFLNYQSCSLQTLVSFSRQFVDLVGQFENQKLLSSKYQLELLDNYSGHSHLLAEYQKEYNLLTQTIEELLEVKRKAQDIAQRSDYVQFQINELEKLNPSVEDELQLISKKRDFLTLSQNKSILDEINYYFEGNEHGSGILSQLKKIENLLTSNILSDQTLNDFQDAIETIKEVSYQLNTKQDLEINEEEFNNIIDRLDLYQTLKRKFNVDTQGLITIFEEFKLEQSEFENLEDSIQIYQDRINDLTQSCSLKALELHKARLRNAKKLEIELTKAIQNLNMHGAHIEIRSEKLPELNTTGLTSTQFYAQTNPGEGFYPIKEIASGGELSRILLAVRNVLSTKDSISVFLFDEIDTGVGGETALTIGKTLEQVAANSQVIAITHLPQIANFAKKLIVVSKEMIDEDDSQRTVSTVREVMDKELKKEVSSMTPLN